MSKKVCALVTLLVLLTSVHVVYAQQCKQICDDTAQRAGWVGEKLVRGSINILSGWLEIPAKIDKNVRKIGGLKGLINGAAEGGIWALYRTAAGLEDVVTSPLGLVVKDKDAPIDPPILFNTK